MTPKEVLNKLKKIETAVITSGYRDIKTKREIRILFNYIKKLITYQIPNRPINISDDRHKFECPTCHTKFDSEDVVDDFYICYICGQRWKEDDDGDY